jgi:imidazole glycerol-phosphate synthase subunit HisH
MTSTMDPQAPHRVCILDYGSGNVRSVFNLLCTISPQVDISNDPEAIRSATHLILPGVGAFGAAMKRIRAQIPLDVVEDEVLRQRKPFLGICVGFQVLADKGHEFGEHDGLGWLGGSVDRLESGDLPVPHVGWNSVEVDGESSGLLDGIQAGEDFYFVHSFVFRPSRQSDVVSTTDYGETFASAASRDNIHGVQFHPEKSQRAGRRLIENFLQAL